jgi:RluA family pseudouridine synthase
LVPILYQDDYLLVVDKPAGLPVLPDGWTPDAPYLRRMLEAEFGSIFVVHRLDKTTSGVMVFARDAETHRHLNGQFEEHTARKIYHAIVEGRPDWQVRSAAHKLRMNVGKKHRTVIDHGAGKPALTMFRLLKRGQDYSLIAAAPVTGRTHQVRVHAAAIGHPLLADVLYGASPNGLIARPALHAAELSFVHPARGDRPLFNSPYPDDFARALEVLKLSDL